MSDHVTIVSGFPRSGTSMMMQILQAGGMPVLCDDISRANEHNPRGYLEYSKTRTIVKDSSWIKDAKGMAIKVMAVHLRFIPPEHNYRVIFMRRNVDEIIFSREIMSRKSGRSIAIGVPEFNPEWYNRILNRCSEWMLSQNNIVTYYCDYNDMISNTKEGIDRLNDFLIPNLDTNAMISAVDPKLYRQRAYKVN